MPVRARLCHFFEAYDAVVGGPFMVVVAASRALTRLRNGAMACALKSLMAGLARAGGADQVRASFTSADHPQWAVLRFPRLNGHVAGPRPILLAAFPHALPHIW